MTNLLTNDLNHILAHTKTLWEELRGQRIFITGGTGFFGCWLLESFIWANDQLDLKASAVVLTRSPDSFRQKAPHLATHPAIQFHSGDVRSFEFPEGEFSYVIHGATDASSLVHQENRLFVLDTTVEGTRRVLGFAKTCGTQKLLLTSSGAVYGKQPPDISYIPESYQGAPDVSSPNSVYGEGKRLAELLSVLYAKEYGIESKIARCFAFVGPYLPLDESFAIGNFIKDILEEKTIHIKGDGTPYRSYLYASDLMIWLWTILFKGESCRPYNVGSNVEINIKDTALAVAQIAGKPNSVTIAQEPVTGQRTQRYVPDTQRALQELGLKSTVDLPTGIKKTLAWYQQRLTKTDDDRGD
jgi:dTDP-glucose 4,6-dehydratase